MARFIFKGDNIGYLNQTEETIKYSDVVPLKHCIAIAADAIPPQMVGTITTVGVFEIEAKAEDVFEAGQIVYYSDTEKVVTSTKEGNIVAGMAIAAKETGELTARIKIGVGVTEIAIA